MFEWPALELTDYERRFVRVYKDGDFPGVLRRTYELILNTQADPTVPGLEEIKLRGTIKVSRPSRVFGLSFSGRLGSFRLQISTASGEQFTPKNNSDGYPVVSSMVSGGSWNALAAIGDQAYRALPNNESYFFGNEQAGLLAIDPNWELTNNESLVFDGTPIDDRTQAAFPGIDPALAQKVLTIAVHVWEFEIDPDNPPKRLGGASAK